MNSTRFTQNGRSLNNMIQLLSNTKLIFILRCLEMFFIKIIDINISMNTISCILQLMMTLNVSN